jgi:hypothetical protein
MAVVAAAEAAAAPAWVAGLELASAREPVDLVRVRVRARALALVARLA